MLCHPKGNFIASKNQRRKIVVVLRMGGDGVSSPSFCKFITKMWKVTMINKLIINVCRSHRNKNSSTEREVMTFDLVVSDFWSEKKKKVRIHTFELSFLKIKTILQQLLKNFTKAITYCFKANQFWKKQKKRRKNQNRKC